MMNPVSQAPDLDRFVDMAKDAFSRLPEEFRNVCGDVLFRAADTATPEILKSMEIDDPLELMGLFEGIGLPQSGMPFSGQIPNAIWLYRQPIIAYAVANDETVECVVTHVLIHEIGHHMGFDDDDLERIEESAG